MATEKCLFIVLPNRRSEAKKHNVLDANKKCTVNDHALNVNFKGTAGLFS